MMDGSNNVIDFRSRKPVPMTQSVHSTNGQLPSPEMIQSLEDGFAERWAKGRHILDYSKAVDEDTI